MSITGHPGFKAAINASSLTVLEASTLSAVIEAVEGLFSDFSQYQTASDQGLEPSRLGQEAYPTRSALLSERCIATELRQRLPELFSNSSSDDPRQFMTASEIIAYESARVDQNSSEKANAATCDNSGYPKPRQEKERIAASFSLSSAAPKPLSADDKSRTANSPGGAAPYSDQE